MAAEASTPRRRPIRVWRWPFPRGRNPDRRGTDPAGRPAAKRWHDAIAGRPAARINMPSGA